jgi:hypothetical protein
MANESSGGDIVLPIRLSTEEAERAWADMQEHARRSGRATAEAFDAGAKPLREAGGLFGDLREKMLAYRREETQQSRATRFFAQEFASLIPVGGEVSHNLSKLALVLGGGMGLGAALELAKWAIESFVEAERKAAEMSARLGIEAEATANRLRRAFRDQFTGLANEDLSERTKRVLQVMAPLRDEIDAVNKKVEELDAKGARIKNRNSGAWTEYITERVGLLGQKAKLIELIAPALAAAERQVDEAMKRSGDKAVSDAYYQAMEQLRVQFHAKDKELSREAVLVRLDERAKIAQQLAYQIEDLKAFGVQGEALQRAISNARKVAAEKDRQLDIANVARDREIQRAAEERQYEDALTTAKAHMEKYRAFRAQAGGITFAYREEMRGLDEVAAKYGEVGNTLAEVERLKTEITQRYVQQRIDVWKRETVAGQMTAIVEQRLAQSIGSAFAAIATHSRAYEAAMIAAGKATRMSGSEAEGAILKWTQETLGAISQQAAVKAVFALAEGLAMSAGILPGNPAAAFAAAATYGAVAGVAAAVGYGIGEYRPMTQEERAQVEGGASLGGAGGGSTASAAGRGAGAGAQATVTTVRDTLVVYVADPFETAQEAARRAARRIELARRLNMFSGQTIDVARGG